MTESATIVQRLWYYCNALRDDGDLDSHYLETLIKLGTSKGMLGVIFHKAQNCIQDPAKLRHLIALNRRSVMAKIGC